MSDWGDRIAARLSEIGMTPTELARACGIRQPSVHAWLSGDTKSITGQNLLRAAAALGVTAEWIQTGRSGTAPVPAAQLGRPVSHHETRPGYIRFHVMGEGGAGPGMINTDYPEVLREVELAEWQVRDQLGSLVSPKRVKLLTVRGDSMSPRIRSGDVVFVDIEDRVYDGDGNYVVVLHGHTLVKRLELRTDGLHIVSLADATRPDIVPPADMPSLQIAGRVLGAIQFRRAEEL